MKAHLLALFLGVALAACSPPADQAPTAAVVAPEAVGAADTRAVTAKPESARAEMKVTSPAPNAHLQSGFTVEGSAPGTWYFEAVFPITLVDEAGKVLAEAPGQAVDDWMTEKPVRFKTTVSFKVSAETKAWLVLARDNETGEAQNDAEIRIPVTLVPGP